MAPHIIIRGKNTYGKTRAEQEANLRKDGFVSMSDEHFDRLKYSEKRQGLKRGFIRQVDLARVR